ncbi:MAG: hypothetical protein NTX45_10660 [Proteobacteria bacterium]|nr:hypothetical protein [Pseudomonadota bacterium]
MKKLQALVLLPMDASYKRIAEVIEITLNQAGVTPILPRDIMWQNTRGMLDAMTNAIQEADIIVADVSSSNPNIFFELGFALAFRKPTIVMLSTNAVGGIPSDIAGYMMVTYDPDDMSSLEKKIFRFIEYQVKRRSASNA